MYMVCWLYGELYKTSVVQQLDQYFSALFKKERNNYIIEMGSVNSVYKIIKLFER